MRLKSSHFAHGGRLFLPQRGYKSSALSQRSLDSQPPWPKRSSYNMPPVSGYPGAPYRAVSQLAPATTLVTHNLLARTRTHNAGRADIGAIGPATVSPYLLRLSSAATCLLAVSLSTSRPLLARPDDQWQTTSAKVHNDS